jgi:CRISPR-associated protein Cas1
MRAQAAASLPLQKRLWQSLVKAKVAMQGAALEAERQAGGGFDLLARKVRSGDPDNVEAQAARRYWPLMMGKDFRRDSSAGGANAMLNYGYTVLRAATARAVMAAGLHPTFGLAHRNRSNPMPLVDDLMEPFRPMADRCVLRLLEAGHAEVTPEAKAYLAAVTNLDMEGRAGIAPLSTCLERLAASLAAVFEGEARALELPGSPLPLSLPPPPAANLAGEDPC